MIEIGFEKDFYCWNWKCLHIRILDMNGMVVQWLVSTIYLQQKGSDLDLAAD